MRRRDLFVNLLNILGHQPELRVVFLGKFGVLKEVDAEAVSSDDAEWLVRSPFVMPDLKTETIDEHFDPISDVDVKDIWYQSFKIHILIKITVVSIRYRTAARHADNGRSKRGLIVRDSVLNVPGPNGTFRYRH